MLEVYHEAASYEYIQTKCLVRDHKHKPKQTKHSKSQNKKNISNRISLLRQIVGKTCIVVLGDTRLF